MVPIATPSTIAPIVSAGTATPLLPGTANASSAPYPMSSSIAGAAGVAASSGYAQPSGAASKTGSASPTMPSGPAFTGAAAASCNVGGIAGFVTVAAAALMVFC
jgi:hypothetical protein